MKLLMMLVLGALVLPAVAAAKPPARIAPPGDSAISQYVEDVPTARGAAPSPPGAGGQGGALTPAQGRQLARLGPQGHLLASVVNATAPAAAAAGRSGSGAGAGSPSAGNSGDIATAGASSARSGGASGALPMAGARSPASLLVHAFVGGGTGGLGIILPAMMVATALGAVAWSVRRRRTAS